MTHFVIFSMIVASLLTAGLAALVVVFIKNLISKSRRTFDLSDPDGTKVTFTVGDDENFSDVLSRQLSTLQSKQPKPRKEPAPAG
jgi:hypothetical protein